MALRDGYIPVRQFSSADGLHRLVIFQRPDGFFGYAGDKLTTEDGDTFWEPAEMSGIYETANAAEYAALADVAWLHNNISN